jgi:general stress protein 26
MGLFLVVIFACGLGAVGVAYGGETQLPEGVEEALKTEPYIYVATRRLNGDWSTAAPVWFMYNGGVVYFTTSPSSHKAHRIHRGSPVRVWVGRKDGPSFEGEAKLIKDKAIVGRMAEVYREKYWLAWLGLFRPKPRRVGSGKTLLVKVTPTAPESAP